MQNDSFGSPFDAASRSATDRAPPAGRDLARFLYNHNPFYVISTALVLYGLRVSFLSGDAFATRAMIVGLMSFTLLLASTAWLIIRLGSVWNDARTILLIMVLLFVAISVACDLSLAGFDAGGARDLKPGIENFLGSYLFALVVSEGMLLTLGIGLRFWYRLSYHLFLACFFLYPLAMLPLLVQSWNQWLPWALFGFSFAAAAALLALLPAVRRGASYIHGHGTPWQWPYFPWSLFVILTVAAGLRHYYLCVSYHAVPGTTSLFRPYFLVPPLLAVNVLLLEAALVAGRRATRIVALSMPLPLVMLAAWQPATTFWQRRFLDEFSEVLGGAPVFLTLVSCIALYAMAAARRLPGAFDLLILSIAGLAVIRPAPRLADLAYPEPLVIAGSGLLLLLAALVRRSSPRLFLAACLVLAALTIDQRQQWLVDAWGEIPWHLLLAVVLIIGALPNDRFARVLQNVGAAMLCLPMLAWVAWWPTVPSNFAATWGFYLAVAYPLMMAILAIAYGNFVDNKRYFAAATACAALWSLVIGQRLYDLGRQLLAGFDYLLFGAGSFVIAALISLLKTGLPQRWWGHRKA